MPDGRSQPVAGWPRLTGRREELPQSRPIEERFRSVVPRFDFPPHVAPSGTVQVGRPVVVAALALRQAKRLGAEILVARRVVRIDPARHWIELDGGEIIRSQKSEIAQMKAILERKAGG